MSYSHFRRSSSVSTGGACAVQGFIWLVALVASFIVGGWSVNYLLATFASHPIPFFWAGVIGCIGGQVLIPIAIIVYILVMFGVI